MKTSVRKKATGAVLAAALLCGGATACTSSSTSGTSSSPDKKAGQKPLNVEPAAAVKQAAESTEKLTSFSYRMKGQTPEGQQVTGEAGMNLKPLAMKMQMSSGGETVEFRLTGDGFYMGGGKPDPETGKSWLKFPAAALKEAAGGSASGSGSGQASQAEQNPATEAGMMEGAENVKKVGTETVDGVETTHYTGTVTLAAMRAGLKDEDAATKQRREKQLKQYEKQGLKQLTMDMWIDGDNHTKQFRTRGATKTGPLDMTMTFFDLNEPVTVTAPPAAQVMDLGAEMAEGQQG
ncbi:DUF1396 domain-containing protein [Streptomyces sp. NPDC000410]|uniref:DUF1396 domain-containing protein n=1 Tax=Streptomyces sp. NPDC000410 TaxID=3154254 RepID=UPI003318031E